MKGLALWLGGVAILIALIVLIAARGGVQGQTLIALAVVSVIAAAVGFIFLRRR